jgi:hypothetical protein
LKRGSSIITQATPAPSRTVPQLQGEGETTAAQPLDHLGQIVDVLGVGLEARWKLGQQGAQLASLDQRCDSRVEHGEILGVDDGRLAGCFLEHARVGELLPQLDSKAEV